jgi:flagellar hook-associated protein 2
MSTVTASNGIGTVTSGTGIISGLNTSAIITALLANDQTPITALQNQVTAEKTQQQDLDTFSADVLAIQNASTALKSSSVLNARTATSSNPNALSVTASANAAVGNYQFQAVNQAQTQQLVSTGFANLNTTPVGAGTITVKAGGFVNSTTSLSSLNGGNGVQLGQIQITNQAGAKSVIDLSTSQTLNDVINAINQTPGAGVLASVSGDSLVLTDQTGASTTALSVQNVSGGTTASDLGLVSGTTTSGNTLTGAAIVKISGNTRLSDLNDGNGVETAAPGAGDFRITGKDGSVFTVDVSSAATVQDVLNAINKNVANDGSVVASISNDGTRLVLTDNSGQSGTLTVAPINTSSAAQDLGISGTEQGGGVLTGSRVQAGLNSVLLSDLNGGKGIGTAGQLQLTDRSGASKTIDLSSASSLSDVVAGINGAGLGIAAQINAAGNGIQITDTTGASASNLQIADVGGSTLATKLNIATNAATTSVNSGDLNLKYISENTSLSSLNGGSGVQAGKIRVTDSKGNSTTVDLSSSSIKTIGDVINALNTSGVGVTASLNSTGDGLLLTDTAGGSGPLNVADVGGTTTAADLNIAGNGTGSINGAYRWQVTIGASDTLQTVQNDFTNSKAPVTASTTNSGSGSTPYRLIIQSNNAGKAGQVLVDTGSSGLSLSTLVAGSDAELKVGTGASALLFSSANNQFQNVAPGLNVTLTSTSTAPISVSVGQDSQPLTDALNSFVSAYNQASTDLSNFTTFNTTTNTAAPLTADSSMFQAEQTLSNIVNQTYGSGGGTVKNLSDLGITISGGQLSLNTAVLDAKLASSPSDVQNFFNTSTSGFADKAKTQLSGITDASSGAIAERVAAITTQETDQQSRITLLQSELATKQNQLQAEFTGMEQALSQLQSAQTLLTQMASAQGLNYNVAQSKGITSGLSSASTSTSSGS